MIHRVKLSGYDIIEPVGKGSFGRVFRAKRLHDGAEVAVKVIDYSKMSEMEKELLVNEVNILRKLRHHNIVGYYDRIVEKNTQTIYLIMEYCSGGDLQHYIKEAKENISEDQIWLTLAELVSALDLCQSGKDKIIHRDIKPGNIFIDQTGHVKLGDFGLAKPIPDGFTRTILGTPYYMSPEIVSRRSYDEKSDIWALGCVIYEMAARMPPFRGITQDQLNGRIKYSDISRIPREYSDELWHVIQKMLQKNPEERISIPQLLKNPRIAWNKRVNDINMERSDLKRKTAHLKERKRELLKTLEDLKRAVGDEIDDMNTSPKKKE